MLCDESRIPELENIFLPSLSYIKRDVYCILSGFPLLCWLRNIESWNVDYTKHRIPKRWLHETSNPETLITRNIKSRNVEDTKHRIPKRRGHKTKHYNCTAWAHWHKLSHNGRSHRWALALFSHYCADSGQPNWRRDSAQASSKKWSNSSENCAVRRQLGVGGSVSGSATLRTGFDGQAVGRIETYSKGELGKSIPPSFQPLHLSYCRRGRGWQAVMISDSDY